MIKKLLLLTLFFYILILLQTSLLFNFPLVIIAVIIINIFYKGADFDIGTASAFIGGFFLDVFSSGLLGIWVLILSAAAFIIQLVSKKYVRTTLFKT